jgi:dTMP kinase
MSFQAPQGTPRFFCLEGIDGCGKSTQINLLLEELGRRGIPAVRIREPGGTEISERIRTLILTPSLAKMSSLTELLLYSAARAQLLHEVVAPALAQGKVVIADRFAWSTLAYQGYGRGISFATISSLIGTATAGIWPQATFLLDIPVSLFQERSQQEGRTPDRMELEKSEFFEKVRQGYQELAQENPAQLILLDGTRSPQEIHKNILTRVLALLTPT